MEDKKYTYRKVNPSDINDINRYLAIQKQLKDFLKVNARDLTEEQIKWLRIRMGAYELLSDINGKDKVLSDRLQRQVDEIVYLCEVDDEVTGFCAICTYHIKDGERLDDNIGIISDIYVKEEYRNGDIAYKLLQLAIKELLQANKTAVVMEVQEDNPNRFLHFALADKILFKEKCKRNDGTITISYSLLISDVRKIQKIEPRELALKAIKIKKDFIDNKLEEPRFILS